MSKHAQERSASERRPQPPEAVDTRGAAEILGISPATLSTLRCRGGGPPFVRYGRAVRYVVADLRAWRSARAVRSTSEGTC